MPHNHSPRCCCSHNEGADVTKYEPCPSCVEHGELASLNSAPIDGDQCPEESPSTGARCFLKYGHPGAHLPAECPSCHAIGDQPHTDYCQARIVTVTHPLGLVAHVAQPEWCGQPHPMADHHKCRRPAGHAGDHETRHGRNWPTQTSQPAATTSQPATHTRTGQEQAYCGLGGGHPGHTNPDGSECNGYPPSRAAHPSECTGQPGLGPMGETVHHAWCPIHG